MKQTYPRYEATSRQAFVASKISRQMALHRNTAIASLESFLDLLPSVLTTGCGH